MITTHPVENAHAITQCAALARQIWMEWYTRIIGAEQVRYMLQTAQSAEAITQQIKVQRYRYRLVRVQGTGVGYFATVINENALHISKLYVVKSARAHGVGRFMIEQCRLEALRQGSERLELTVNRHNPAMGFYIRMGFENVGPMVQEIGGGFVMDDYVFRRNL